MPLTPSPVSRLGYAIVVTVSDSASAGEREDLSGPEAARILTEAGFDVIDTEIVPDERNRIQDRMRVACDREGVRLVVTTGGTGLSPRDVTPEATQRVIEREVPGLALLMRLEGIAKTPKAALSRGIAGIRGTTLVVNLPGSVKGVRESLDAIMGVVPHALETLGQSSLGCGG